MAVVADMAAQYNVDPKRVYLMGHSNGGFMAHRLACEHPQTFAAIFSLAGATWLDPAKCPAGAPVNVLQLHGDQDETILYQGGSTRAGEYPSAAVTVATWADKNGCTGEAVAGEDIDLSDERGAETARVAYAGCPAGGAVELWTIRGGSHLPPLANDFFDTIWAWFEAHPKP
jgi:polyhydroxybutyrate depolymerase